MVALGEAGIEEILHLDKNLTYQPDVYAASLTASKLWVH